MILYVPVTYLKGHPPFEHNNVKEGGAYNTLYIWTQKIYKLKWAKIQIWYRKQPSNFTKHVLRPSSLRNSWM